MSDLPTLPTDPKPLREASPESFAELTLRDPEGYQRQDRDRIIEKLREDRLRFEAAEAAGKKPKQAKLPKPTMPEAQIAPGDAQDLGF